MDERPSSKRYEPPFINLNNMNNSHTLVVKLVGVNNLILEVGTSTGYMTKFLRNLGNRIIGVEIDEEAAEIASKYCDLMITGDVEELDLDEYLGPSSIDVVIFADVLEHLKYPAHVLKKIRRYLKPQGSIVISIPNICHGDVLLNLLEGDFKYTSMGLLDETHLRFFGLKNVVDLLNGSGYSITEIEATRLPVGKTELRRNLGEIPREIIKFIDALPNSDVYQFVLRAKASENPKNPIISEADLREIFDRSIEGLLREHEQPLKCEIVEICSKHQVALERIVSMGEELHKAVERAGSLDQAVSERDAKMAELGDELKKAVERAGSLDQAVSERDAKMAELGDELQKAVERAGSLDQAVSERDARIGKLGEELQKAVERAGSLDQAVSERDARIGKLGEELQKVVERAGSLDQAVSERDSRITELNDRLSQSESHVCRVENEITEMQRSIIWQLMMKYHNVVVERALPHGTVRRRKYDLGLKGGRILVNEGWGRFWWAFRDYRRSKVISYNGNMIPPKSDIKMDDFSKDVEIIDKKISVIIPTKNAGPDFEYILEKIRNQKRIKEVQIVVVDSGSADDTVKLAERYRAEVYSIKPEEFNHGETRNYGASKATGDYLLFMVQDAIPIGDYWLYSMMKVFKSDEKIAAVTCRQVPRSDADLFANYSMWNHYRSMEFDGDKIVHITKEKFQQLSGAEKRKMAGLDNVCSCIEGEVFSNFKFNKTNFAEDLDMGMRLIESGYKLAFLYSAGVIHSHIRPPSYSLKRYYVDTKYLFGFFPATPQIRDMDVNFDLSWILSLYKSLCWSVSAVCSNIDRSIEIDPFILAVKHNMSKFEELNKPPKIKYCDIYHDQELEDLLLNLNRFCDGYTSHKKPNLLYATYFGLLEEFHKYSKNIYVTCDVTEAIKLLYDLFAVCCGSHLGNVYNSAINYEKINEIDALLSEGV